MRGRLGRVGRLLDRAGQKFRMDLAMDLGTANTLVYVKGNGIVVNEPSLIALDTRSHQTIAIGKQAREYLGRGPAHIKAERPLKNGVIADFEAAMAMIKGFLAKAFTPRFWLRTRIVIGVPSGITQVERRAVRESAYEAGARHVFLVEEPMAAALGAGLDVDLPVGNLVVDIGGGTTEVAVISLCATAYCESIRVAGDEMDEAILRYLLRNMHLEITPALAEEIKIRIGCVAENGESQSMTVTGKELGRGGPRTVTLTASDVSAALEETVDTILDTVRRALENAPPALLSDIEERGLVLTGGGALLNGLDSLIHKMTGIPTYLADDPLASVVRGCGIFIEDPVRWERIAVG
ncbi:MAG: rod shape-determining protein [Desulfomonilaceae bacterium]